MGVLLILVGLVLVVTAYRNTIGTFAGHLQEDVSGEFLKWVAALVLIGVVGYIPGLSTLSRVFLALVVLVVVVKSGSGLVAQFNQALTSSPPAEKSQAASGALPDPTLNVKLAGGSGGSGGILGTVAKAGLGVATGGTSTAIEAGVAATGGLQ